MTATLPDPGIRLPAHLEVAGLIRRVEAAGGFAVVIQKGEREAGSIMIVLREKHANARVYERMPSPDGPRIWTMARNQDIDNNSLFDEYVTRRGQQDPDLWIIELDIANGERFIGLTGGTA